MSGASHLRYPSAAIGVARRNAVRCRCKPPLVVIILHGLLSTLAKVLAPLETRRSSIFPGATELECFDSDLMLHLDANAQWPTRYFWESCIYLTAW